MKAIIVLLLLALAFMILVFGVSFDLYFQVEVNGQTCTFSRFGQALDEQFYNCPDGTIVTIYK